MRVLLDYHELLAVVEDGVPSLVAGASEAQRNAHREMAKKDKKALYFIHQGLNDDVFEKIDGATSAKQAWDTLSISFRGEEKVKKVRLQTLRRQYELLQMESSELVGDYITRVLAVTNQMYGEAYKVQEKVEKILRTLTTRFEHIVVAIEEAHDLSEMTVDELSGTLQAHEQRMNEKHVEKPLEQALQSQVSIKSEGGGGESDSDAPEEFSVQQGIQQDEEIRKVQSESKARVVREVKERRRQWAQKLTPRPPREDGSIQDVAEN